jgi:hypothetical protein
MDDKLIFYFLYCPSDLVEALIALDQICSTLGQHDRPNSLPLNTFHMHYRIALRKIHQLLCNHHLGVPQGHN